MVFANLFTTPLRVDVLSSLPTDLLDNAASGFSAKLSHRINGCLRHLYITVIIITIFYILLSEIVACKSVI